MTWATWAPPIGKNKQRAVVRVFQIKFFDGELGNWSTLGLLPVAMACVLVCDRLREFVFLLPKCCGVSRSSLTIKLPAFVPSHLSSENYFRVE